MSDNENDVHVPGQQDGEGKPSEAWTANEDSKQQDGDDDDATTGPFQPDQASREALVAKEEEADPSDLFHPKCDPDYIVRRIFQNPSMSCKVLMDFLDTDGVGGLSHDELTFALAYLTQDTGMEEEALNSLPPHFEGELDVEGFSQHLVEFLRRMAYYKSPKDEYGKPLEKKDFNTFYNYEFDLPYSIRQEASAFVKSATRATDDQDDSDDLFQGGACQLLKIFAAAPFIFALLPFVCMAIIIVEEEDFGCMETCLLCCVGIPFTFLWYWPVSIAIVYTQYVVEADESFETNTTAPTYIEALAPLVLQIGIALIALIYAPILRARLAAGKLKDDKFDAYMRTQIRILAKDATLKNPDGHILGKDQTFDSRAIVRSLENIGSERAREELELRQKFKVDKPMGMLGNKKKSTKKFIKAEEISDSAVDNYVTGMDTSRKLQILAFGLVQSLLPGLTRVAYKDRFAGDGTAEEYVAVSHVLIAFFAAGGLMRLVCEASIIASRVKANLRRLLWSTHSRTCQKNTGALYLDMRYGRNVRLFMKLREYAVQIGQDERFEFAILVIMVTVLADVGLMVLLFVRVVILQRDWDVTSTIALFNVVVLSALVLDVLLTIISTNTILSVQIPALLRKARYQMTDRIVKNREVNAAQEQQRLDRRLRQLERMVQHGEKEQEQSDEDKKLEQEIWYRAKVIAETQDHVTAIASMLEDMDGNVEYLIKIFGFVVDHNLRNRIMLLLITSLGGTIVQSLESVTSGNSV